MFIIIYLIIVNLIALSLSFSFAVIFHPQSNTGFFLMLVVFSCFSFSCLTQHLTDHDAGTPSHVVYVVFLNQCCQMLAVFAPEKQSDHLHAQIPNHGTFLLLTQITFGGISLIQRRLASGKARKHY